MVDAQKLQREGETAAETAKAMLKSSEESWQHQKDVLDGELAALKSRPKLEQALADLEERNNEMEELLKKKCAEIEQNDDRVLE